MIISEKTRDLIFEIREYSGDTLLFYYDISILIENSFHSNKKNEFLDIIFRAKFLNGTLRIIQDEKSDASLKEKISSEYQSQLKDFIIRFKKLIEDFSPQEKELFEAKYLSLTTNSLNDMTMLIKDLTIIKNFSIDNSNF
ncbi:MAG: hypothetical protein K1X86_15255 [Ignavibacteria bacterium]|nr:hypothetical protein [Ignavibacteria bacterium]